MKKSFDSFWDDISDTNAARQRAEKVILHINKYRRNSKSVLELGSGNGNVLKNFAKNYEVTGLDVHRKYLALVKKKIPGARTIFSSMHNFRTQKRFDVIFSVYDSVNFMEDFGQWKKMFRNVYDHLQPEGLFIFDMYPPKMLEKARTMKDFTKEKFGYMSDIGVVKGNMLTWDMAVFEKKKGNNYEMHQFYFTEHIFPVSTVEKEMKKHFNILEKLDSDTMKRPTVNTTRLLYVARKKD